LVNRNKTILKATIRVSWDLNTPITRFGRDSSPNPAWGAYSVHQSLAILEGSLRGYGKGRVNGREREAR